ncbi:MAG TPA: hypothetical protein VGG02_12350 [Chthoniobacterales bacterium]
MDGFRSRIGFLPLADLVLFFVGIVCFFSCFWNSGAGLDHDRLDLRPGLSQAPTTGVLLEATAAFVLLEAAAAFVLLMLAHAALGVFRRFEVAHFHFFFVFICSHFIYLFLLLFVWLMSVAPKSS